MLRLLQYQTDHDVEVCDTKTSRGETEKGLEVVGEVGGQIVRTDGVGEVRLQDAVDGLIAEWKGCEEEEED